MFNDDRFTLLLTLNNIEYNHIRLIILSEFPQFIIFISVFHFYVLFSIQFFLMHSQEPQIFSAWWLWLFNVLCYVMYQKQSLDVKIKSMHLTLIVLKVLYKNDKNMRWFCFSANHAKI